MKDEPQRLMTAQTWIVAQPLSHPKCPVLYMADDLRAESSSIYKLPVIIRTLFHCPQ